MSGAFLRRRDRTVRSLRVVHYSSAVNSRFYRGSLERILLDCEAQRPLFGVCEGDESFFGARRVKDRRGRGAYGKTVVFDIFDRQGQVYTEIVPGCSSPTLQGIIRGRVDPSTAINSAGWRGYTTGWSISATLASASTTPTMSSAKELSTSTASRVSGGWPRSGWQSSRASPTDTPSTSTSWKPNGDTTIATPASTKPGQLQSACPRPGAHSG